MEAPHRMAPDCADGLRRAPATRPRSGRYGSRGMCRCAAKSETRIPRRLAPGAARRGRGTSLRAVGCRVFADDDAEIGGVPEWRSGSDRRSGRPEHLGATRPHEDPEFWSGDCRSREEAIGEGAASLEPRRLLDRER